MIFKIPILSHYSVDSLEDLLGSIFFRFWMVNSASVSGISGKLLAICLSIRLLKKPKTQFNGQAWTTPGRTLPGPAQLTCFSFHILCKCINIINIITNIPMWRLSILDLAYSRHFVGNNSWWFYVHNLCAGYVCFQYEQLNSFTTFSTLGTPFSSWRIYIAI